MFKKTLLISIAIAFLAAILVYGTAKAATITPGPLVITYDGDEALFSEGNIEPGDKISRTVAVRNNGTVNHNFAIATRNVSGELASKILLSAIENNNVIWTQTIAELEGLATVSKFVTALNPGQTKQIVFEAEFPSSSGNDVAGKSVSFDIIYGTEEPEPTGLAASSFSFRRLFATASPVESATISPSPTTTPEPTATPFDGAVKGESTESNHKLNPLYLLLIPAGVVLSAVLMPEFAFTAGMAVVAGAATYILGSESTGPMATRDFIILLIVEVILLAILCYFFFKHENKVSRKIRGHKHRLRLR